MERPKFWARRLRDRGLLVESRARASVQAETEASSPQPPPPLPSAMQMSGEWEGGGGPGGKITQPWLTMTGWRKIASGSCNHILGVRTGMSVIKLNQKNRFNISATSHTT